MGAGRNVLLTIFRPGNTPGGGGDWVSLKKLVRLRDSHFYKVPSTVYRLDP